jgi:hypothetical protein
VERHENREDVGHQCASWSRRLANSLDALGKREARRVSILSLLHKQLVSQ